MRSTTVTQDLQVPGHRFPALETFRNLIHAANRESSIILIYSHLSSRLFLGISFGDVIWIQRLPSAPGAWGRGVCSLVFLLWSCPSLPEIDKPRSLSLPLREMKCRVRASLISQDTRCHFRTLFLFPKWPSDLTRVCKSAGKMLCRCCSQCDPSCYSFSLLSNKEISLRVQVHPFFG